jgi:hypothetical protein
MFDLPPARCCAAIRRGHWTCWNEPWRGLWHELRRHPGAEVRDEALAVDMAAPKYFWTT